MPFGMTLLHDLIASGCCWLAQPTNPSAAIKKTKPNNQHARHRRTRAWRSALAQEYTLKIDKASDDGSFYRAILAIHKKAFDEASVHIETVRPRRCPLVLESALRRVLCAHPPPRHMRHAYGVTRRV